MVLLHPFEAEDVGIADVVIVIEVVVVAVAVKHSDQPKNKFEFYTCPWGKTSKL